MNEINDMHDRNEMEYLFRIFKTLIEMMKDRGYLVQNIESVLDYSLDEFIEFIQENINESTDEDADERTILNIGFSHSTNDNKKALVYFTPLKTKTGNLGLDDLKPFIELVNNNVFDPFILIISNSYYDEKGKTITSPAKEALNFKSKNVEIFMDYELRNNVTKHMRVPEHFYVSEEEQKEILARNDINASEIANLLEDDQQARYYGWKAGQMVGVYREYQIEGDFTRKKLTYKMIQKIENIDLDD